MSFIDRFGRSLDRTIGVFSPQSEVKRAFARHQVQKIRKTYRDRQYAAAKSGRHTGDWAPVNQDVNTLIRTSSATIRARTRQLVRDCPFFKRAVEVLADFTIGPGIKFQSRVKFASGKDEGKPDKTSIRKIEDFIKRWMDDKDVTGKLYFPEMERLVKRQDTETGEFLIIKRWLTKSQARGRHIPFALQAIEPDWLTTLTTQVASGNLIDQGIEYDKDTGQAVAYHFQIPNGFNSQLTDSSTTVRVLAKNVIHGFETLRPGQMRGISPFTTAILGAHDLSDYLDTEMEGAKMAAKWVAFITSDNPTDVQDLNTTAGTGVDEGKQIEEMENGIIEYLRRNESITLADHKRPGDSFSPFVQFELRMASIATGTTYELLTNDYQGINYTTSRTIRNDFEKRIAPQTQRHTLHFTRQAIYDAMDAGVMAGKLDLRGYFRDPRHFQKAVFIGPGMKLLDPLRESKAHESQLSTNLKSPQQMVAEQGGDYEETLDEFQAAMAMHKERGIPWLTNTKGAGLQQNPAKLGADENNAQAN